MIDVAAQMMTRPIVASLAVIANASSSAHASIATAAGGREGDRLSGVCLQTLCELALHNPRVLALGGGVSSIVKGILVAESAELNVCLVSVLLYLLNKPLSRNYVRHDVDLEAVIAPITDAYYLSGNEFTEKGSQTAVHKNARFNASRVAVVAMMRTWTGLVYMCCDNNGLQALVDALYLPHTDTRSVVMDIFFDLLHVDEPDWSDDFLAAMKCDVAYHAIGSADARRRSELPSLESPRQNLWDNYMSMVLACAMECGLVAALVEVG